MSDAYDKIDRFLRNNLDDEAYAEYSEALDMVYAAAQPEPAAPAEKCTYKCEAWPECGCAPSVAPEPLAFDSGQVLAILGAAHLPRAPLTDAEIGTLWMSRECPRDEGILPQVEAFARAIEAAHGISAEGEKT